MESLWNKNYQAVLLSRIEQLNENSPRKWGKMDVPQMLEHMNIAYKNAIDEIKVPKHPLSFLASLKPIRKFLIYGMPFQKNLPTAKDYMIETPQNFQENKKSFLHTFQKITQKETANKFDSHPIFGKLTYDEWGTLLSKHLDHHLKQFGV
jgi:hypothetical protein